MVAGSDAEYRCAHGAQKNSDQHTDERPGDADAVGHERIDRNEGDETDRNHVLECELERGRGAGPEPAPIADNEPLLASVTLEPG